MASPIASYEFIPLTAYELQAWDNVPRAVRNEWMKRAARYNDRARALGAEGGVSGRELYAMAFRHQNSCVYCHKPLAWGTQDATFDHVKPLGIGGTGGIENLVPSCRQCNQDLHEWDQRLNTNGPTDNYAVPHPEFGGPYVQQKGERREYKPRRPQELLQ